MPATAIPPDESRILRLIASTGPRGITSAALAAKLSGMPAHERADTLGRLAITGRVEIEAGLAGEITWRMPPRPDALADAKAEAKGNSCRTRR